MLVQPRLYGLDIRGDGSRGGWSPLPRHLSHNHIQGTAPLRPPVLQSSGQVLFAGSRQAPTTPLPYLSSGRERSRDPLNIGFGKIGRTTKALKGSPYSRRSNDLWG